LSLSVSLSAVDIRSDANQQALAGLSGMVYPPAEVADWPGHRLEWAAPEWDVFVVDDELGMVSYTGAILRDAEHDGKPVHLGGVGGVKTHPDSRGRGHAAAGLRRATEFFETQKPPLDFALLVCNDSLLAYYSRFGWQQFHGDLLTLQGGEPKKFEFNNVMVMDLSAIAPTTGRIDLLGPPW